MIKKIALCSLSIIFVQLCSGMVQDNKLTLSEQLAKVTTVGELRELKEKSFGEYEENQDRLTALKENCTNQMSKSQATATAVGTMNIFSFSGGPAIKILDDIRLLKKKIKTALLWSTHNYEEIFYCTKFNHHQYTAPKGGTLVESADTILNCPDLDANVPLIYFGTSLTYSQREEAKSNLESLS